MNGDRIAGALVGGLIVAIVLCDPVRDLAKRTLTMVAKEAQKQLPAPTTQPEPKES